MKRIFALIVVLALVCALLCSCGEKTGTIKTTVNSKYVDDYVKPYAEDVKTEENGNITYQFSDENYKKFLSDYNVKVKDEAEEKIQTYGQYSYLNPEGTEYIVGIMPEAFDKANIEDLKKEAEEAGKAAIKYQMNTNKPVGKLTVIYKNCSTGDEYFRIEVEAEK